jgi:spermidine synthase
MSKDSIGIKLLYLNSFIAGLVTLIIEIAGTRIMAPFFGTTVFTWSALIGVTLLSLAVGYYAGGIFAEKNNRQWAVFAASLAAGAVTAIIMLYKDPVLKLSDLMGAKAGVITASILLFSPALFILGAISPLSVKFASSKLGAGKSAGMIFAVSTAGSFLGAILAGYWLIPHFGIRTVFIICSVLPVLTGLAGIAVLKTDIKPGIVTLCAVLLAGLTGYAVSGKNYGKNIKVVYEKENHFGRILIIDSPQNIRILMVDGTIQMYYDLNKKESGAEYVDLLEKGADLAGQKNTALVIGAGAGALTGKLEKRGIHTDNVEIDKDIAFAAKEYFGSTSEFIIEDGRRYIRRCGKTYDMIFFDVFKGYSICPYMATKESFQEAKNILNQGGVLSMNIVAEAPGPSGIHGNTVNLVYSTMKSVFKDVKISVMTEGNFANYVFYASDSGINYGDTVKLQGKHAVLTDDKNNMENIYSSVIEKWRDSNKKLLGSRFML